MLGQVACGRLGPSRPAFLLLLLGEWGGFLCLGDQDWRAAKQGRTGHILGTGEDWGKGAWSGRAAIRGRVALMRGGR